MKINKKSNNSFFIFLLLMFFSFGLGLNDIYVNNYILFGYDSNVSKISSSESLDYNNSPYISFKPSIKTSFQIFKNRKTKISFSSKINHYFDVNQKSNNAFYLNISQPIGNYQLLKFYHAYVNNIYLREFIDQDELISPELYLGDECYFDLIKYRLSYESPYFGDKEKLEFSIYNELQYYSPKFTEYDLSISGMHIKYFTKRSENRYSFQLGYAIADSLFSHEQNLLTGDFGGNTLRVVDRSYEELSIKFSYDFPLSNKNILGFSFSRKQRKYLSEAEYEIDYGGPEGLIKIKDDLHVDREHRDIVFNAWYTFKYLNRKNKLSFSYREKDTISPEIWVENLKSFSKFNLEYFVYFEKIKFKI